LKVVVADPVEFKFKVGAVVVVVPVGRGFEPLLEPVRLRFKAGVVPVVYCAGPFGLN
jgi:hypothetical protein